MQRLWVKKNWGKSRGEEREKLREEKEAKLHLKNFYAQQQQHNQKHQQTRAIRFLLTSAEESSISEQVETVRFCKFVSKITFV